MKKLLALLMALVMVVSVFAGCGGNTTGNTENTAGTTENTAGGDETTGTTETPATTETPVVVEPEELPEALKYWSFDDATGLTAVAQVEKAADSINDGATYDIGTVDSPLLITETGVKGNALYLDGTYGAALDLSGVDMTTDTYTIAFWLNADRLSTFGPTLQLGRNMGDSADATSDSYRTCTWINFTQCEWGTSSAKLFPIYWNRNSDFESWPWGACYDDEVHGKREWVHVALVVSGTRYTCADDGFERVTAKYYLDGECVMDASDANNAFYQGVAPEILLADGLEGYLGVNYWDTMYKGFFDELYIYDCALTDGQVMSLYLDGDSTVEPVAPEGGDTTPETEAPVITPVEGIVADENAVDVVGTTDLSLGWWSDWSGSFELTEGTPVTMKLNNYSSGANIWNNFLLVFANVATPGHAAPADTEGYAEYAVMRADAWGWGDASYNGAYTVSWEDWTAWRQLMTDAEVTLVLSRSGSDITVEATFVGADGTTMTSTSVITSTLTSDAPCYFFVTAELAYVEILSVE